MLSSLKNLVSLQTLHALRSNLLTLRTFEFLSLVALFHPSVVFNEGRAEWDRAYNFEFMLLPIILEWRTTCLPITHISLQSNN